MPATATTPPAPPSTLYGDIIGGVTTFFTMAYIVVVNPSILATPGQGCPSRVR
jgi:AGZA family xanthine/uracil permease-like MFS transporter